jgi:hypothetical protein
MQGPVAPALVEWFLTQVHNSLLFLCPCLRRCPSHVATPFKQMQISALPSRPITLLRRLAFRIDQLAPPPIRVTEIDRGAAG